MENKMASFFQTASLVASPSYPNSVAWSDENLVAVASGHLVTILNPSLLIGPRGLITIPPSKPFPIGVINREDLLTSCLLSICLSRDVRPCVRSISWSHLGLAPNSGCLLAVCTTEGRVKLYRSPYFEFSAEWIEVKDISDLLFDYLLSINFGEVDVPSTNSVQEQAVENEIESGCCDALQNSMFNNKRKQKITGAGALGDHLSYDVNKEDKNGGYTHIEKLVTACTEMASFPCSVFNKGSSVEVLQQNGTQCVWVGGVIKRVDGAKGKALVRFPEKVESGKKDQWVELNPEYDTLKDSSVLNGTTPDKDTPSPKVRPFMDVGNLPEQIFLLENHEVEGILSIGQKVEAWTKNRWVEGLFMGFNGHKLSVKLSGDNGCVMLNSMSVRLAPVWNSELKSWQATLVKIESRGGKLPEIVEMQSGKSIATNLHQYSSVLRSRGKETPLKRTRESDTLPLLTAGQYASRSSMLSSVIVAWSPALYLSSDIHPNPRDRPSSNYGLLAVGGKSGKISFWRIDEPRCYAVENSMDSVDVILVGLLQAHNSWITAISWGLSADASKSQVLLVTGSSDGSVKVWLGDIEVMLNSSEVSSASFSLLKEVTTVAPAPVSVLSLTAPARSLDEILLAIGRGSGSLEVWICDILSCKFQCAGLYDAHGQVVTGLAWGFDGRCLYSCSQDNSIRCWVLHESALHKVPIPSNSLGLWRSTDLPHASDSCFGLAISPGNLVVAVARGFDATLLNPMYQARTQKAAVEFFWIGGQQLEVSSDINKEFDIEAFPGFSKWEMMCWESNILWSLTKYDNTNKPLVLWDVITALSALKQYTPDYVKRILVKWFSSWLPGCNIGVSIDEILLHARDSLTKIHSRRMHLLNIFCSRLILNNKQDGLEEVEIAKDEYLKLWMELLVSTESQLRERLVAFSFTTVLRLASSSATNAPTDRYWLPHGVAQMEQWVAINNEQIQDHLKLLLSEVGKLGKRLHSISEYVPEEQCRFCPASVPFESPEVASCVGSKNSNGVCERHKLSRCAASMQVCPTTPMWFCVCCHRWIWKLPPQTLFTMSEYPSALNSVIESSALQVSSKPFCPFCGILLQRLQAEFLLSASPV